MGVKLKVCYFKSESELNEKDNELYKKNIVSVTRQFYFSASTNETIDMVVSVNGIPVIALELKNQFTSQTYENAIVQYKERDFNEKIFRLNYRFLVYFAVDHYETWMTTVLKGENTYFLPFNQGSNGADNSGGKGNPANPNGSLRCLLSSVGMRDDYRLYPTWLCRYMCLQLLFCFYLHNRYIREVVLQ